MAAANLSWALSSGTSQNVAGATSWLTLKKSRTRQARLGSVPAELAVEVIQRFLEAISM